MAASKVKTRVFKMELIEANALQVCERASSSVPIRKPQPASPEHICRVNEHRETTKRPAQNPNHEAVPYVEH